MNGQFKVLVALLLIMVSAAGLIVGCENSGEQKAALPNISKEGQTEEVSPEEENATAEEKATRSDLSEKVQTEEMSAKVENATAETKVIAYYFYTNYRCYSCYMIENYTKEAIESNFENELTSEKLVFKPVNIEVKENEHFINDYQLYTKSVVLSLVKDGKEVKFKNLNKVWELLMNKENFFKYIEEETQAFLYQMNGEGE